VQNVDIEWAFDIEVFDIECYGQYRRSDTRYRGGKDPDVRGTDSPRPARLRVSDSGMQRDGRAAARGLRV
jgi:hypothetical protein